MSKSHARTSESALILSRTPPSIEIQTKDISRFLQQKRFHENVTVIVVCKPDTVSALDNTLSHLQKKKWHGRKPALTASLFVTESTLLQATIDEAASTVSSKRLFLVISGCMDHVTFDIPKHASFTRLCILKCPHDNSGVENLFISGMSTFQGLAVQDWQDPENLAQTKSKLYLGPGVYIQVVQGLHASRWNQAWDLSSSHAHTANERKHIRGEFEALKTEDMNGEWWKRWRDRFSLLMGGLSGASTFAMGIEVAATGIFFQYKWSTGGGPATEVSTELITPAALATVAGMVGKATLIGPGVAAGIYFIPWGTLLSWLSQVFVWIKDILNWLWEKIKSLASTTASYFSSMPSKLEGSHQVKRIV